MTESNHKDRRLQRYTPARQKEILEYWKNSGMSKTDFCKEQGIAPSTLYKWLNQSKRTTQSGLVSSLVQIIGKKGMPATGNEEQVSVEVLLPTETTVRFKLPIRSLTSFITEFSHATTIIR